MLLSFSYTSVQVLETSGVNISEKYWNWNPYFRFLLRNLAASFLSRC